MGSGRVSQTETGLLLCRAESRILAATLGPAPVLAGAATAGLAGLALALLGFGLLALGLLLGRDLLDQAGAANFSTEAGGGLGCDRGKGNSTAGPRAAVTFFGSWKSG